MNSPFPWPGGKRALQTTLLEAMPPHAIYVEVFSGSAKLLFAKAPARCEVMNDLNGEVINFFRVAKHRAAELAEMLERECIHAGRFRELRDAGNPECEMQRAVRFAYLAWYSFGGKGGHFASGSALSPKCRHSLTLVRDLLQKTSLRLASVLIEQRDFAWVIARYDSPGTFFYLDPPYVRFGTNARYKPLAAERREELFDLLAKVRGKFLLSFDDCAEVRQAADARAMLVREVAVKYTIAGKNRTQKPSAELLISNYPLPGRCGIDAAGAHL